MFHRALVPTLLACGLGACLPAASMHNRQFHDVDLRDVQANPKAYQGLNVRFRCTFVQQADLFTPFHTPFSPERYINLVVWDDQAAIWNPEVRAEPLMSLYFPKQNKQTLMLQQLDKFDLIDVSGEVVAAYRAQPWIQINNIAPASEDAVFDAVVLKLLEEAAELHEAEEYELAEQNYAAALADPMPDGARIIAMYQRARNLFHANRYEAGVQHLANSLDEYRDLGEDLPVDMATMHYQMARAQQVMAERTSAEEAIAHFESGIEHASAAIDQRPGLGKAHATLGICLAGIGQLDDARLRCHRAVRMLPDDAEVRWHLGKIYHLQKEYDLAIETLKRAIDLAPKDYRIHKSIAAVYFGRGRTSQKKNFDDIVMALREYDIAIRLEPNDPDLFFFSGQVIDYAAENEIQVRIGTQTIAATPELAVKRYIQCLAVDNTYAPAHVELGAYYRSLDQHEDALSHYQSAVDLRPTNIELRNLLGQYYWALERRSEAYATYLEINQLAPEHVPTLFALQRLASEQGDNEQGITWGDMVLAREADHLPAHVWQAELLERVGRYQDAIRLADRVLIDDDDAQRIVRAKRVLVMSYWALDDLDQVVAIGSGIAEDEREPALVRVAIAWAQSRNQQPAERLLSAQQVTKALGDHPMAQEFLAHAYHVVGAHQQAKQTLENITGKIPSEVYAYRMGMILFHWGPDHYAAAVPFLEAANELRDRRELLHDARNEARAALRDIRDYNRDQERAARQRQQEAERQARIKQREKERAEREAEKRRRAEERAKKRDQ
jgi:tetratricopeptide (TPR) repeat protein